jgi:hypothetical protein
MAFQFQCPQGHLLEGDESQAGQAIHCPVCQMLFLIPAPVSAPAAPAFNAPEFQSPPANAPQFGASGTTSEPAFQSAPAEPELLHIPCPKGHILEVPPDMLDTEVLCPQCNEQFELRARDSIEHKKKKKLQEELREERSNKFILNFAITAVVLVVLMLITLAVMTVMNTSKTDEPKPKPPAVPAKSAPVAPMPEVMPEDEITPPAPPTDPK